VVNGFGEELGLASSQGELGRDISVHHYQGYYAKISAPQLFGKSSLDQFGGLECPLVNNAAYIGVPSNIESTEVPFIRECGR